MAIQSDYMKNRLLKNNQEKVNNARRALYILGGYAAFSGLLLFTYTGMQVRGVGNLLFAGLYFVIGSASNKDPILHFRIGFWLSLVMAFFSVLALQLLPAFAFSVVSYFLYIGIDSAKYLAEQAPAVIKQDDILDANMWEDEEK